MNMGVEGMDRTNEAMTIREGMDVVGSDGNKVGEVVAVHQGYVVVEKGFFFPTDYYIPSSAIASNDGDKVYLNVTKDAALDQGWDVMPGETGSATTDTYATGSAAPTAFGEADVERGARGNVDHMDASDRLVVPVHEEELTASKRDREIGQVSINKSVVEDERTLEVPLTEERVTVQRRTVDRDSAAGDDAMAFQEGTIDVPIRGEEVDLQKRTRVAEEVEINKEGVQRTEQVSGTVRREEINIDEKSMDPRNQ